MIEYRNMLLLEDGREIPTEFVSRRGLSDFTKRIGKKTTVDFVGFILDKNGVIVSLPKHFYPTGVWNKYINKDEGEVLGDITDLMTLLAKGSSSVSHGDLTNFPIDSYIEIQNYFKKFGLFSKKLTQVKSGYAGHIDWKATFRRSSKIIQENGILFMPFQITQTINRSSFISECMEYALSKSYSDFKGYLNFLTPYNFRTNNPFFNNYKRCKAELVKIKQFFFKDTEKKLIEALIQYFEWLSRRNDKIVIATKNFELYWEALVSVLLDTKFGGVDSNGKIIFADNVDNKFVFKPPKEKVEDSRLLELQSRAGFSIAFDHIRYGEEIYLFDSKYISSDSMGSLNYKQAFYYYYLRGLYPQSTIINGLIIPTSKNYSYSIHIDRDRKSIFDVENFNIYEVDKQKIDGLKILEHKANLRMCLKIAASNLGYFQSRLLKSQSMIKI